MTDVKSSIPLLVSAFLAAGITGGTSYAFGLYGEALKEELSLTQSQLDTISSASFCAGVLSWIPGLLADKFGEKCAMIGGGLLGAISLTSFWLIARKFIYVPESGIVALLSTCNVMIFMASALITGSVFKIIVSNTLPKHKGNAVGAAKGFVGLGSGAFAAMFEALDRKSDLDFLPMAGFFFLAACSLPAIFLLPGKDDIKRVDLTTSTHYSSLYLGLVAMGVIVAGEAMLELLNSEEEKNKQREGPDYFMTGLVTFIWFAPILGLLLLPVATHSALPSDVQDDESDVPLNKELNDNDRSCENEITDELFSDDLGSEDEEESLVTEESGNSPIAEFRDRNLAQMLMTLPAWLMLWAATIQVGGGTVMTNNMGQMVVALNFNSKVTPAALSLFSVAQSFARVISGSLSSMAKRRTSFLILASVLGLIAHSLLAIVTEEVTFVIAVLLSGLAFGMVWPLMVLISGELFGVKNVGANYMFYDGVTSALGTIALSKFVAQKIYEDNIDDGVTCYGQECFQTTNWIIAGLSITGILGSWLMSFCELTKRAYD